MNLNTTINILIQAANLAQSKGAYSLQEAALVYEAIQNITNYIKEQQENTNEVKDDANNTD